MSPLPSPTTSLIGRESALLSLSQALQQPGVHLLTLVGPPGVGKNETRNRSCRSSGWSKPARLAWPQGRLLPASKTERGEDLRDVVAGTSDGDAEALSDLLICEAFSNERQHLPFAGREDVWMRASS